MCTGKCSRFIAIALYPLALLSIICNIVLFFPGGDVKYAQDKRITTEVTYMGGVVGGGIMVSCDSPQILTGMPTNRYIQIYSLNMFWKHCVVVKLFCQSSLCCRFKCASYERLYPVNVFLGLNPFDCLARSEKYTIQCHCIMQFWCQLPELHFTSLHSCVLPQVLLPALYIHLTGKKGCCGNRCGVSFHCLAIEPAFSRLSKDTHHLAFHVLGSFFLCVASQHMWTYRVKCWF